MPGLFILFAEVILFALLATFSARQFGLADGARITLAYLVAYLVPRCLVRRAHGTSLASQLVLFVLAGLLIYLDFIRLNDFTLFDGYSLQEPNLRGDARQFYKWALHQYDGRFEPTGMKYPGFPYIMLGLWKLFGLSVVWPQAMNLMFTLSSVVLTGILTRRLLVHRVSASPAVLFAGGMGLACLLTYYLIIGTSMLKEGSICVAIMMAAIALSPMAASKGGRKPSTRDMVLFVLACILLALVRTTYLYFVAMGVVILTLPHWRRDWVSSLVMLVILGVSLFLGDHLSSYSLDRHAEIAGGGWNMQRFYVVGESQRFYHDLLDYYFLRPFWYKAMMLPLTMSVQFFIPLPWCYYDNPTLIQTISRFTYGWYLVGGTALFYFFVMSWRKKESMGVWPWWPAIAFAAVAYVVAGSVARYVVPILPLFVPVAMYVICRVCAERRWRKAFIWWWVVLVIVIAAVLVLCLEIQQATISKMLHTQSLVNYWNGLPY